MQRWLEVVWPFALVVLAPLGTWDPATQPFVADAWAGNAALAIAAYPLVAIVHEGGHALIGLAVGGRIARLQIGRGRRIASFAVAGTQVQLGAVPVGGMTWIAHRGPWLARLREALWTVGGPAASVGLLVALLWLERPARPVLWLIGDGLVTTFAPLQAIALVNVLTLASELLRPTADGDLMHLLRIPFRRDSEADVVHLERLQAADDHLGRGDHVAARAALAPSYEAREELPGELRVEIENAWAWTLAVIAVKLGDAAAAREAVRVSAPLHEAHPSYPWLAGTHGAALIAAGRDGEAVPLLRVAFDENTQEAVRAHDASWLAIAAARAGRADEAAEWLARAEELDPQCHSIPLARGILVR
jgi:hypothetical protein